MGSTERTVKRSNLLRKTTGAGNDVAGRAGHGWRIGDEVLIEREQLIVRLPAPQVRQLMRKLGVAAYSVSAISSMMRIGREEAVHLLDLLQEEGLVERMPASAAPVSYLADEAFTGEGPEPQVWTTTVAGNALARARIGKPMARAKAESLLDGVVERARAANESDHWLDWVHRVVLYGSVADETKTSVGDVDVGVVLVPRVNREQYRELTKHLLETDRPSLSNFVDQVAYPARKLLRYLRAKSPRIDLVQLRADGSGVPAGARQIEVYRLEISASTSQALSYVRSPSGAHRRG